MKVITETHRMHKIRDQHFYFCIGQWLYIFNDRFMQLNLLDPYEISISQMTTDLFLFM